MTIYHLDSEHEWADFDDIHPERPVIPEELLLPTIGDLVDDVEELSIYSYKGDPPHFMDGREAVDVSDEQLAFWRSSDLDYMQGKTRCRRRIADAAASYESAVAAAVAEFRAYADRYRPTAAEMEANTAELAALLMRHRNAAEEYKEQQEAKKQAELDALHGKRRIVLYEAKSLSSHNKADWIARVHLNTCRYAETPADGALRVHEAWKLLKDPFNGWMRPMMEREEEGLQIKFCGICKPWRVFMEYINNFPRQAAAELRLTEYPYDWDKP